MATFRSELGRTEIHPGPADDEAAAIVRALAMYLETSGQLETPHRPITSLWVRAGRLEACGLPLRAATRAADWGL